MIGFGSPDRCHRIGSQTGAQSGVSFKLGKILRYRKDTRARLMWRRGGEHWEMMSPGSFPEEETFKVSGRRSSSHRSPLTWAPLFPWWLQDGWMYWDLWVILTYWVFVQLHPAVICFRKAAVCVSVLVRLKVSAESSRHLLGQWESSASLRLKWRFRPLPPPPSSLVSSTEKTLLFPGTFPLLLGCLDHLCLPLGFVRIYEWPRVECGAGLHGSWKKISTKLQTTDDKCGWLSAKQETLFRIIFKGFFSSISNK